MLAARGLQARRAPRAARRSACSGAAGRSRRGRGLSRRRGCGGGGGACWGGSGRRTGCTGGGACPSSWAHLVRRMSMRYCCSWLCCRRYCSAYRRAGGRGHIHGFLDPIHDRACAPGLRAIDARRDAPDHLAQQQLRRAVILIQLEQVVCLPGQHRGVQPGQQGGRPVCGVDLRHIGGNADPGGPSGSRARLAHYPMRPGPTSTAFQEFQTY